MSQHPLRHRDVLLIAVPIIISNVTTPLIGFVDAAVIGRLGVAHLIGGVAIGAVLFNMLYCGFGEASRLFEALDGEISTVW